MMSGPVPGTPVIAEPEGLEARARALDEEARYHKREAQRHRRAAQIARQKLSQLQESCTRLGIAVQIDPS